MAAQLTTSSFLSALLIVLFAAAAATMVSAQESALAPAPISTGSAFSVPVSGAVVGASLFLSLLAFLKH